ncbi:hypothetical protein XH97_33225 [Bradyrhizobium sp. CCBAU 53380]|nr:hypothetical protein [Bradyrhizobium sp. CCBAU 53380]
MIGAHDLAADTVASTVRHADELSRPRRKLLAFKQNLQHGSRAIGGRHAISPLSASLLDVSIW